MHERHIWDRGMHRCSTKAKITTQHPLYIKLQRNHRSKDSTKTVQPQEKQGQIWRATGSDGPAEWKSFSLNKHGREGSHNHREEEAEGDTSEQEEAQLWSCGHKGRLTKVLIERPLPYVPQRLNGQPDDDDDDDDDDDVDPQRR